MRNRYDIALKIYVIDVYPDDKASAVDYYVGNFISFKADGSEIRYLHLH